MILSAENYTPQTLLPRLKKQAWKVWVVSFAVVFVWTLLILLAPFAAVNDFSAVAGSLYKFFSFFCHQESERSFHFAEHQFAVCARCFGVYFGLLAGFVVYPFLRPVETVEPLPRFWLFLAMIPMAIDWSLGFFGVWENTLWSRFLTGLILGAACAVFIVPALVEIVRLFYMKKRLKRL